MKGIDWSIRGIGELKRRIVWNAPIVHAVRELKLVFLIVMISFWMSGASEAVASSSNWVELARACEDVIADQSFAPLEKYEPAPFSMGSPGKKDYAVYDASRNLVAIARAIKGEWVFCLVRESEESRSRFRDHATDWENDFEANFLKSEYIWVGSRINPNRPYRGAMRCRGKNLAVVILPNLETNFYFRVAVNKAVPRDPSLCGDQADVPARAAPTAKRVMPGPVWRRPQ